MFARAAKDTAAPTIKAAARISEYFRSAGREQWVVGGRIDGRLLDVGFMLLASALHVASLQWVQPKTQLNAVQATSVGRQRVVSLCRRSACKISGLPSCCARVIDQCSLCTLCHQLRRDRANGLQNDATSPHNHSTRRALRVVAVDEQQAEDIGAARQGRIRCIDEAALPRHRKRAARI